MSFGISEESVGRSVAVGSDDMNSVILGPGVISIKCQLLCDE